MKKLDILVLVTFLFSSSLWADVHVIPENTMSNPIEIKDSNISESDFRNVINILHKIYAPKIKEKGNVDLIMNAVWEDATVNAYASRETDTWTIHINGGIARAKGMTKDSLALIICHELGHHLGGAPRTFLYDGWPSAEGQADYWATSKCMKNYYEELKHEDVSNIGIVPDKIIRDCSNVYLNSNEIKICVKTQLAALDFSSVLNSFPDVKKPIQLDTPDDRIVKGTNTNHYPRPQCRFDTMYQGALCDINSHVATSETDAKIGHCNDTTKLGSRPRCWYKPQ